MFTARPDAGGAAQIKHIRFAVQKPLPNPPTTTGSACPTSASDHVSFMSRPGGHIVSTVRPEAGGATQVSLRSPIISHSNTTDFESQLTASNHINNQPEVEVTPARSISGGTAFTTTIPDDFQLWIPPLPRHGRTSAFIANPPGFFQENQHWEPLRVAPTPILPTWPS